MDEITILMNIIKECDSCGIDCELCPFSAEDEYNDLYCRIQRITGTFPDSWKEVKS